MFDSPFFSLLLLPLRIQSIWASSEPMWYVITYRDPVEEIHVINFFHFMKKTQIHNFWTLIGNIFVVNLFAGMWGRNCKSQVCQSCPHICLLISLIPDPYLSFKCFKFKTSFSNMCIVFYIMDLVFFSTMMANP